MTTGSLPSVVSSQREAARRLGISHTALQKAVRTGRVRPELDGTWNPDKLRQQLDATADPGRVSPTATTPTPMDPDILQEPAKLAIEPLPPTISVPSTVPPAASQPARQAGTGTFQDARTANEVLKAQDRRLRLDERRGKLVDKGRALLLVHRFAREERDAMPGWPARVAAVLAAQLGVDPHRLQMLLDEQLRQHLVERSRVSPAVT